MTLEDRVRELLREDADRVAEISGWDGIQARLGRPRRSSRPLILGAAALIVAAVAVGITVWPTNDRVGVRTGPVGSPTTATGTEGSAIAEVDGLQLEVDAPATGAVGTRIEVRTVLRNTGSRAVSILPADDCTAPVAIGLRQRGSHISAATEPEGPPGLDGGWDGEVATLAGWLRSSSSRRAISARQESNGWARYTGECGVDQRVRPKTTIIEPGAETTQLMTLDLRWGTDPIGDVELVATTGPVARPVGGTIRAASAVTTISRLDIRDDPRRLATVDAALGADGLVAAPTLPAWLEDTRQPAIDRPVLWAPDLAWWRGGWELWIDSLYGSDPGPIRIRWDPDARAVTDVRTVTPGNSRASDDLDAPTTAADVVRYHKP